MDKIIELKRQHADIIDRAEEIVNKAEAENRDFTPEEKQAYDAELARAKEVSVRIERQQDLASQRDLTQGIPDDVKPGGDDAAWRSLHGGTDRGAHAPFRNTGEQLVAIARACRPSGAVIDKRLLGPMEAEARAAGTGVNEIVASEGGYLMGTDFVRETYQNTFNNNELLSRVTRRTMSAGSNTVEIIAIDETSRANGSRFGGVRVYTKAELAQLTSSRPKWRSIEMRLEKLTGLAYVSNESLSDGPFLAGEVGDLFRLEFGFKLQDLLFRGTGAGEPLGVLNSGAKIEVAKESGQAADTVVAKNISKMWSRMVGSSRGNAIWTINQEVEPQLDELNFVGGTAAQLVYMPAGGLSDAPYGRIKGKPVIDIEQASALGDVGDISLLDMSQYVFVDKGDIDGQVSIHLMFDYDQTAFRWTYRCDGRPRWSAALTPYKGTSGNTLSPFVMLAAR